MTKSALMLGFLLLAGVLAGCASGPPPAGSTDPHGPYSPEEAKAAALQHLGSAPAPKAPGGGGGPKK